MAQMGADDGGGEELARLGAAVATIEVWFERLGVFICGNLCDLWSNCRVWRDGEISEEYVGLGGGT